MGMRDLPGSFGLGLLALLILKSHMISKTFILHRLGVGNIVAAILYLVG